MHIRVRVDGTEREADVRPDASLLSVLRDTWGLTATKNACRQGECGSCSVLLDGELVAACIVPAFQADGREVGTVESAAELVRGAFVAAGAVQCGFCTPGMVVAVAELLARSPHPDDEEIREALAGNLCRCTGYAKILDAVRLAAGAAP